jgi:hypothetical protein
MNTSTGIISEYIEALTERAEQAGDDRLSYAMGVLHSTLQSLQFSGYKDLEQLQKDTQALKRTVKKS